MITQVVEGGGWGWLRYGVSKAGIVLWVGWVGMFEMQSIEIWDRITDRAGGDG